MDKLEKKFVLLWHILKIEVRFHNRFMNSETPSDDSRLIRSLRAGEVASFDALFYRYERRLYGFCLKLLRSPEEAEEIVQEVFLRVWENRSKLDEQQLFNAYLIRIAKNLIFNKLKRQVTQHAYEHYHRRYRTVARRTTEEDVDYRLLVELTQRVVAQFPPRRKQIFHLSRAHGHTNQQIADQLNISVSTVENHLNAALKLLRQCLVRHHLYVPEVLLLLLPML